jgi:LysM repeat protein
MKLIPALAFLSVFTLVGCASQPNSVRQESSTDLPTLASEPLPTPAAEPVQPTPASEPSAPAAPETPVATVDYVIKEGDSLWKIAHEHNTSVKKIRELNNLTSDTIRPGKKLKVPQP